MAYVTKRENIKRQMKDNAYKAIMFVYSENHTRDTYKLYNQETKRFIMTSYIKWAEWKMTNQEETMKMFCNPNKYNIVLGIEEDKTPTSEP